MSGDEGPDVRVIVVMGVSGAGKTVVGEALAKALGWKFYDADEFHSALNIAKMHRGEGLTDDDRLPWLATLTALVAGVVARNQPTVLACSALKQWYRNALVPANVSHNAICFVYLDVPLGVLRTRLAARTHHFATPDLLPSQFATLEIPRDAICVDGTRSIAETVETVRTALGLVKFDDESTA